MDHFESVEAYRWPPFLGVMVLGMITWAIYDYRDWVNGGTGGTPPTISGWLRVCKLRAVTALRCLCGDDLRDPSVLPRCGPAFLSSLETRKGGHPVLKPRILPQRQYSEPIEPKARQLLFGLMRHLHSSHPNVLTLALSKAEGGDTDAIYASPESATCNHEAEKVNYEIAHVHPTDNSLHMLLSPADARVVIKAGWGRRFPVPSAVPPGWIMVYAPRDFEEVILIQRLLVAAIQWATGTDIQQL